MFLGWINTSEIPALCKIANIGLCADLKCTESDTGARNRLNEMMKFGLPILTSKGTEISEIVENIEAGETFNQGDSDNMAHQLLKMLGSPKQYGENGIKYTKKHTFEKSMKPVKQYLKPLKK